MSEVFRTILVALDRRRRGEDIRCNSIAVAKKLGASLRAVYAVGFADLRVLVPAPPLGQPVRLPLRGTPLEARLSAEGREELERFAASCRQSAVKYSGDVFVGDPQSLWVEEARSSDLAVVFPAEDDFGFFARLLGSGVWDLVTRACRPALALRRDGPSPERMVLFYGNRVGSARALPWVASLCLELGMWLTVYLMQGNHRDYSRDDECEAYLERHGLTVTMGKKGQQVLARESKRPGGEFRDRCVLAFDGSFRRGSRFGRRRRLVERLIRTSHHGVLLCP